MATSNTGQTQILGEDEAELRRKMELLKAIGDANVLALAALLGEEEVIKEYLDEYPNDVSYRLMGEAEGVIVLALPLYIIYIMLVRSWVLNSLRSYETLKIHCRYSSPSTKEIQH